MSLHVTRLRLFAACIYELLSLFALWMLCTWIFVRLFGDTMHNEKRYLLQLFLWLVTGAYFVQCWVKTGQTLASKTWKIKLVTQKRVNGQNTHLNTKQALLRYALASASMLVLGLGFIWALFDKEGLFLHDRLLNTRFIRTT